MIRKLANGEYRLFSKKKDPKTGRRRNLGTFKTRTAAIALSLAACRSGGDAAPPDTSGVIPRAGTAGPGHAMPRTGLAVMESDGTWCAEFVADSGAPGLEPGQPVTLVFAGPAPVVNLRGRIRSRREGQCPAEFPQPRWNDYGAYGVALTDSLPGDGGSTPSVALIVASETSWRRGTDGVVRADLDEDGRPEEARRCTADEGEHWTVWTARPEAAPVRRWHEYYDWGAITDPTCGPGEDGQ